MNAEEMFKELGYEKKETECRIDYLKFNDENKIAYVVYVSFHKELKCFEKFFIKSNSPYEKQTTDFSMKQLQAINQQCKELGWLE